VQLTRIVFPNPFPQQSPTPNPILCLFLTKNLFVAIDGQRIAGIVFWPCANIKIKDLTLFFPFRIIYRSGRNLKRFKELAVRERTCSGSLGMNLPPIQPGENTVCGPETPTQTREEPIILTTDLILGLFFNDIN